MQECPTDLPSLPSLFDPRIPDNPVLWAVLKGVHSGKAFVNDIHYPSQCVIRTDANLTFASQQINQDFLDRAIAFCRHIGPVWLVWSSMYSKHLLVPQAVSAIQRLEFFDYDPNSSILADWRQRMPNGFEIRAIDWQLLERCEWRDDMEFYCGSLEKFIANELGLCMMQGDDIVVEAYVSSFGESQAEIGAVTREAYRGHSYAPIACAYLIEACEQRGYHAYWSCDCENIASARVARKLGFIHEMAYQIFEYDAK